MRILVTGGAGFIGSHTCDRLLELGHDVVVLDSLAPPVHRNGRPAYLSPGASFYPGDTRNRALPTASRYPICAPRRRWPRGNGTYHVPCAAARSRCRPHPSASPTRRTRTACPSWARRWSPSTSAADTVSRPPPCATASSRGRG